MNLLSIKDMYEYIYWAFDLIWPYIDKLSDDQFVKDLGYSLGSIRNQIVHLISSHQRWLYRLQYIDPPPHLDFEEYPTKITARIAWDAAKSEMLGFVSALDQDDLNEKITYEIQSRSIQTSNHRWEILLHLFNHATDHRSQILTLLNTKFLIDTPEQDYIFYLWEKEKKHE